MPLPINTAGLWLDPATGRLHDRATGEARYQLHPSGWLIDLRAQIAIDPSGEWAVDPARQLALHLPTQQYYNLATGAPIRPGQEVPASTASTAPVAVPALARDSGPPCLPAPAAWPWEPAPQPFEGEGDAVQAGLAQLLAQSPGVRAAANAAQAAGIAKFAAQQLARFLPPGISDAVKLFAELFQPLRELITKTPCVDPSKPCGAGEQFAPDGRTFGKTETECCMPTFAGMGVVFSSQVLGRGRPDVTIVPAWFTVGNLFQGTNLRTGDFRTLAQLGAAPLGLPDASWFSTKPGAQGLSSTAQRMVQQHGGNVFVPWDDELDQPLLPPVAFAGNSVIGDNHGPVSTVARRYRAVRLDQLRADAAGQLFRRVDWKMPHRWPDNWQELPAGDYADWLAIGDPARIEAKRINSHAHNMAIVPDGWSITLYELPGFAGEKLELGPGAHNLFDLWIRRRGWKLPGSVRVRGWWSIADASVVAALRERRAGWLADGWPEAPDRSTAISLALQDPCRIPPPASTAIELPAERMSFWRPGWQDRLAALAPPQPAPVPLPMPSQPAQPVNPWASRQVVYRDAQGRIVDPVSRQPLY